MENEGVGECLVRGRASGNVIYSTVPLSAWMGIDVNSGIVIDQHHPLCGTSVSGKILVLPGGRGSCSGSCGLVELIVSGHAPAALIFETADHILALGSLLAGEIFEKSIPVVSVGARWFQSLAAATHVTIDHNRLVVQGPSSAELRLVPAATGEESLDLSLRDKAILAGEEGAARQVAMRIIQGFAEMVGSPRLIDVAQAHIDCCFLTGPAGLAFAEQIVAMGGKVGVPTTTNATTVDRRRWKLQGIDPVFGAMAERVAAAYVNMGARDCFTCAPYLLASAPKLGQQIAWGESNAVAYANSVLGARTMKYPDFLDVCVALTGRAPLTASHTEDGRRATLHIEVDAPQGFDDAFYPLLGYHIGLISSYDIPVVSGLEGMKPTTDDLKAYSAAFATTSSAPMFHIVGITPEASTADSVSVYHGSIETIRVTREALRQSWRELNSAAGVSVGLVSLGNPHFSLGEMARTAALCKGRTKAAGTRMVITCGRDIYSEASAAGIVSELEKFGAMILNDTCWCMVDANQMSGITGALITNSAKFAHYGPGISGHEIYFGSLASCVDAACTGVHQDAVPAWLKRQG